MQVRIKLIGKGNKIDVTSSVITACYVNNAGIYDIRNRFDCDRNIALFQPGFRPLLDNARICPPIIRAMANKFAYRVTANADVLV